MRLLWIVLLIGLAAGGFFFYTTFLRAEPAPNFRTTEVVRGDLVITIAATGTVQPQQLVDVGTQVVGRIKELGLDPRGETDPEYKDKHVDWCSPVDEGTVLARIDATLYIATLRQAEAGLERAKADLLQMEARLAQTDAEWQRAQRLRDIKLPSIASAGKKSGQPPSPTMIKGISDADYILAKANYEVAVANVEVGKSAVLQQEAMRLSAQTNYDFTIIKSPVKGTIIDRRVNVGQTVVSSLNAPSLFLIARDLRRMEVWTHVNEADIGRLKVDMPVRFKVDAFPDREFEGRVALIHLNAQITQNVVTYIVAVSTNNDDLTLLPYLSANAKFEVDKREGVLLVPNAALRFQPRPELIVAPPSDVEDVSAASADSEANGGRPARTVWVRDGNGVYAVKVQTGVTDGTSTEIVSGALSEGAEIVLAEDRAETAVAEANNPFAPPRFRGTKKDKKS